MLEWRARRATEQGNRTTLRKCMAKFLDASAPAVGGNIGGDERPSYLDILVLQCLYVEADRWNSLDCFVAFILESIENGGLASIV